nr:unnamed protein product [Callosobruchus analis]
MGKKRVDRNIAHIRQAIETFIIFEKTGTSLKPRNCSTVYRRICFIFVVIGCSLGNGFGRNQDHRASHAEFTFYQNLFIAIRMKNHQLSKLCLVFLVRSNLECDIFIFGSSCMIIYFTSYTQRKVNQL